MTWLACLACCFLGHDTRYSRHERSGWCRRCRKVVRLELSDFDQ